MLCIRLAHKNPFFCLAAEEFLLKHYADDIFMVWQSDQAVVVGKHQNAMGEINYRFTREKNIRVARRISGGGTVYHDAGNLNFAWFRNVAGPHEISFSQFTQPIIDVLSKLGIKAESSGRNDLLVEEQKISGNAEHVFKNRVLHHGTLLFDADLSRLGDAIRVIPGRYAGKAVASNRSRVANISGFLSQPMDLEKFTGFLVQEILLTDSGNRMFDIPETDLIKIRELAELKFETWEWQFGYSPAYTFDNALKHGCGMPHVRLTVDKGIISEANISGGPYTQPEIMALEKAMPGQKHWFESVEAAHRDLGIAFTPDLIYYWF